MIEKKVKGKNCEWLDHDLEKEINPRAKLHRRYKRLETKMTELIM